MSTLAATQSAAMGQMASHCTAKPQPMVSFQAVRKSYDGKALVVKDLDLDVAAGEFLTMLGPSGSGKTTTLMMLGGFERPTSGHIQIGGKAVEKLPPERRNIGFVFQNYALFPHMSVADNVAFPLRYRGLSKADREGKVRRALDMVHLGNFGDRRPGQLSGGQQQRVALARALVFEPTLVLMDEPLGALDKQLREHMQFEIKRLQTSLGITMVYVTHDQTEALTMSDRIAVFHDGRIQQLADPVTLYEQPLNRFVAGFIGDNNMLDATLILNDPAGARVVLPDGTQMTAANRASIPNGELSLSVRPERIGLAEGEQPRGTNRFAGRLMSVFFMGDHVRLVIEALGCPELVANIPARAARAFEPGERIELECAIADCRLLEG